MAFGLAFVLAAVAFFLSWAPGVGSPAGRLAFDRVSPYCMLTHWPSSSLGLCALCLGLLRPY